MVKLLVEQLIQLILTHHSSQQLENLRNGDDLKEGKQMRRRQYVYKQDMVHYLALLRVDTQYK